MATINLSWTPAGGSNSTSQKVQRKSGAGVFADIATLPATDSTYSDTTAVENVLYTYQIVNICTYGGPTDSGDVSKGVPVCPAVEGTVIENSVTLSYPGLSGDAIYGDMLTVVDIGEFPTGASSDGFAHSFSGDFGTTYNYSVTVSVGDETIVCNGSFTIGAAPVCPTPSGLAASVILP